MASQNSPEAWEAYTGSFPVDNYHFVPTNQLPYQSQVWYSDQSTAGQYLEPTGQQPTEQHPEPGQHPEPAEHQPTGQHPGPTEQQLEQPNDDPYLSSGDEADFAMNINQDQGGMAKENPKDIDENQVEDVTHPVISHGLPLLPTDFQPFRGESHSRSWTLPNGFGSSLRVISPRGCVADGTCPHAGIGEYCASTASNSGDSLED